MTIKRTFWRNRISSGPPRNFQFSIFHDVRQLRLRAIQSDLEADRNAVLFNLHFETGQTPCLFFLVRAGPGAAAAEITCSSNATSCRKCWLYQGLVQANFLSQSQLNSTLYTIFNRFQQPGAQQMLLIRSQHEPHRHDDEHSGAEG